MAFSWASLYTHQATTLSEFITDLRTRINEDSSDEITDTQIVSFIKDGLREISKKLDIHYSYADETLDGSTEYDLPSGLGKIEQVVVINGTIRTVLKPIREASTYSGTDYYIIYGDKIVVNSAISSGTIRIIGQRKPTHVTATASYLDVTDDQIEALHCWVEGRYWQRLRDRTELADAQSRFSDQIMDLEEIEERRKGLVSVGYGETTRESYTR